MKSWDLFDTLIGRKCGTPEELWKQMIEPSDNPNFIVQRVASERKLQDLHLTYNLNDIYKVYGMVDAKSNSVAEALRHLEFRLECNNVFPIKCNIDQVKDEDIIVSDTYFTYPELRELLHHAGFDREIQIISSNYGKWTGDIWKDIKTRYKIELHTGNNYNGDVHKPMEKGIRTQHSVTGTDDLNDPEHFYLKYSPELAYWLRYHRLLNDITPKEATRLHFIELEYNLPFLWASSFALNDYFLRKNLKKLLFMSRDGLLFREVFQNLFPDVPSEYLYISRDCLQGHSKSFFAYLNRRLNELTALVDLTASGGSLRTALPRIKVKEPHFWTAFFLKEPFRVDTNGIDLVYVTDNLRTKCNNSHLERLNYADHWHVTDVRSQGIPVFDQTDEYDMNLVVAYREFVSSTFESMPHETPSNLWAIIDFALRHIHTEGEYLKKIFPNHGILELQRKETVTANNSKAMIISASWNRTWKQIETWHNSIVKSGFTGEIQMIDMGNPYETGKRMDEAGILVSHWMPFYKRPAIVERFDALSKIISKSKLPDEEWVIFTDSDDVVFQRNPSDYLRTIPLYCSIVAASEGVHFEDNRWAKDNLLKSFPAHYESMAKHFYYNAGSIAVRAGLLPVLCKDIVDLCDTQPLANKHDQASFNILLTQEKYKNQSYLVAPDDGWAFCGASSLFGSSLADRKGYKYRLPYMDSGLCRTSLGAIPVIFHHYTRNSTIAAQVVARYRR